MTAAASLMSAKGMASAVRMCRVRKPRASSERQRCRLRPANRGRPGSRPCRFTSTPRTTTAVSSAMLITPVTALAVPVVGITSRPGSRP